MHDRLGIVFRIFVVVGLGLLGPAAIAQTSSDLDTMPNRGFYPLGSYSINDIEAVNNVTGNLTLSIPLATLPPGRGGSSFGLNVFYNSRIFDQIDSSSNGTVRQVLIASNVGGWRYGFQYALGWDVRLYQTLPRRVPITTTCIRPISQCQMAAGGIYVCRGIRIMRGTCSILYRRSGLCRFARRDFPQFQSIHRRSLSMKR